MGSRVIHSDLEKYLCSYLRTALAAVGTALADNVFVSNEFPEQRRPKTVVVRDDSGPAGLVTKYPAVGVTVLAGDDPADGQEATDLALLVEALMWGCPGTDPGNPVAAVLGSTGPAKVPDDTGQPRRYLTFELSVVGVEFP